MPLPREEFIKRATEIAAQAPEGLSREQFEEYVLQAVEPKIQQDTRGPVDRGLDWLSEQGPIPGVIAGAARNAAGNVMGVVDMVTPNSIKTPTVFRKPSGPDETLGAKAEQVGEIAAGGRGVAQLGMETIPAVAGKGLYKLLSSPAVEAITGTLKAVKPGETVGMLGRVRDFLLDSLKPNASANAGGVLRVPALEQEVEQALRARISGLNRTPVAYDNAASAAATDARLADAAASPARAGAATDFTRSSNAGGALRPGSAEPSLEDELIAALREAGAPEKPILTSMPTQAEGITSADSIESLMRQEMQNRLDPRAFRDFVAPGQETATDMISATTGEANPLKGTMREMVRQIDLPRAARVGGNGDLPPNVQRVRSIADDAGERAAHEAGAAQRKGARVSGPGVVDAYARAGENRKLMEMRRALERMMKQRVTE